MHLPLEFLGIACLLSFFSTACAPPAPPPPVPPVAIPTIPEPSIASPAIPVPSTPGAIARVTIPGPRGIESIEVESWFTAFGLERITLHFKLDTPDRKDSDPFTVYRDDPVLLEGCVLGSGAILNQETIYGYSGGFAESPRIEIDCPSGDETTIRSLYFELPVTRITKSVVHRYILEKEGDYQDLGHGFATIIWAEGETFCADLSYRHGSLPYDFYRESGRSELDLFQIHDAEERRVHWTGSSLGGGTDTMKFHILEPYRAPLKFPVRCEVVVPLEWKTTKSTFVLKDIVIPPRQPK